MSVKRKGASRRPNPYLRVLLKLETELQEVAHLRGQLYNFGERLQLWNYATDGWGWDTGSLTLELWADILRTTYPHVDELLLCLEAQGLNSSIASAFEAFRAEWPMLVTEQRPSLTERNWVKVGKALAAKSFSLELEVNDE